MKPFEDALRMIRHSKWWEDHTSHLKRYLYDLLSCAIHSHQYALLAFYIQCAQSSEDTKRHGKTCPWTTAS